MEKRVSLKSRVQRLHEEKTLLFLVESLMLDIGCPRKDHETLRMRTAHEGLSFITKTLPLMGKALQRGIGIGCFTCPSNFATIGRSAIPQFLGSYFSKVFDTDGSLLDNACAVSVMVIEQICFYANKADIGHLPVKPDAVLENFLSTENELAAFELKPDALIDFSASLIGILFKDYHPDVLLPNHGPGSTADLHRSQDKFAANLKHLPVTIRNEYIYYVNDKHYEDAAIKRSPVASHFHYFGWDHSNNIARVELVPKDSRGPRLISMEPSQNQWFQQAVKRYMVGEIEKNPLTCGKINFVDQGVNQNLAIDGSRSQRWSTLDLKDASDRVTLKLVQHLFKGVPHLLDDLLICRSHFTKRVVGNRCEWVLKLNKFAPMGSALCFPVLSVTCWAICVSAIRLVSGDLGKALGSVYVYGDDIIVATQYAHIASAALERYGLKVNRDKSFINSRFCESCGADAFDGQVITPVRLRNLKVRVRFKVKRVYSKRLNSRRTELILRNGKRIIIDRCRKVIQSFVTFETKTLIGLVEHANNLFNNGYVNCSERLRRLIHKVFKAVPCGGPTSPYLCWTHERKASSVLTNNLNNIKNVVEEDDFQRHPYGFSLVAYRVCVERMKTDVADTLDGWAHLLRTLPMLGADFELPELGVYDARQQVYLARSRFDGIDQISGL